MMTAPASRASARDTASSRSSVSTGISLYWGARPCSARLSSGRQLLDDFLVTHGSQPELRRLRRVLLAGTLRSRRAGEGLRGGAGSRSGGRSVRDAGLSPEDRK